MWTKNTISLRTLIIPNTLSTEKNVTNRDLEPEKKVRRISVTTHRDVIHGSSCIGTSDRLRGKDGSRQDVKMTDGFLYLEMTSAGPRFSR